MDPNTDSIVQPVAGAIGQRATTPVTPPAGLGGLAEVVEELAAQDLTTLPDAIVAARVLALRGLLERLEGQWLKELATVDQRGAAGAELGTPAPSTAGWLRAQARISPGTAGQRVRLARALHRGPLPATAAALAAGQVSVGHAAVLADGTQDLNPQTTRQAEPVLLDAARRLDPARLRRVVAHLRAVADPDREDHQAERRFARRGLHVAGTWQGMVALEGLLDPEAGATLLAALDPLTLPSGPQDERSGAQRRADALTELARRALEAGRLPASGGVRPQLAVTIDLASLLDQPGSTPGTLGWAEQPLRGEAARRLACDAAVTRVVTTRHPATGHHPAAGGDGLAGRLRAALTRLPPALGGAPPQILDVGRTTRVIPPPPCAPRWRSATRAAWSPAATGPPPGATPIMCATGSTAARPASTTWCWSAALTTAPSTTATSTWGRDPTGTHNLTEPPQQPHAA